MTILKTITAHRNLYLVKDKRHVWKIPPGEDPYIIKHANAKTFKFFGKGYPNVDYFVDINYVYLNGGLIKDADPTTFTILNFRYSKDHQHVYYFGKLVPEADANSFSVVDKYFGKYKRHIYYRDKIVPEVSPSTKLTKIKINDDYLTDGQHIYYPGFGMIPDVDLATFQPLGYYDYAKDKNNVYYKGEIVSQADPETITTPGHGYITDEHYVFYNSVLVEDLSPIGFVTQLQPSSSHYGIVSNNEGKSMIHYDDKADTVQVIPYDPRKQPQSTNQQTDIRYSHYTNRC